MVNCPTCNGPMEKIKGYWCCHYCEEAHRACEVYSRCVGYMRPVNQWNIGKKQEFKDRKVYDLPDL